MEAHTFTILCVANTEVSCVAIYCKQMLTNRYTVAHVRRVVNTPTDDDDEPVNINDSDTVRLCRESATDLDYQPIDADETHFQHIDTNNETHYQPIPTDETQFTSNEQDDHEINDTDNLT